jgi:uncharacterized FlaG/YvyC family protein
MSTFSNNIASVAVAAPPPAVYALRAAEPANNQAETPPPPSSSDRSKLQQRLDDALKNTGVKAEIENERNGGMIVRLVDSSTGHILIQFPPQAVLDMVAALERKEGLSPSMDAQSADYTPASGANIDQLA